MKNLLLMIVLFFSTIICHSQTQKVNISSNATPLNAYFYQAEGNTKKPTIVWCHGNPGRKEQGTSQFANELNKLGINVIRFNYRGLWGTDGIYKLSNSIEDLSNVLDFIHVKENIEKYQIDTDKIIVGGWSFGTNVIMLKALDDERIKNIFCMGIADHNYFFFTPESLNPNKNEQSREMHPYINDALWGPKGNFEEIKNEFNLDVMRHTYEYDYVAKAERFKDKNLFIVVGLSDMLTPIEYHFLPLHREMVKMEHDHYKYKIVESDHYFRDLSSSDRARLISKWINE